jgi:fatty acyl-CoA reductase
MLELARRVKQLEVFTHVSTCYVNCNLRGLIKEEIYDAGDAEEAFRALESLPREELIAKTEKILGDYPNTYTFTKALCERLMKVRKGSLPLCIVRPAIINTSYE